MPDKKLTDSEIVKALKDCPKNVRNRNCKSCLYTTAKEFCLDRLMEDVFNLINRQQAKNEFLKEYNKNLLTANTTLSNEILDTKAEAYKEFAEKVEDEIYCQPHSKGMLESAERSRIIRIINSVLKELVGEDNG